MAMKSSGRRVTLATISLSCCINNSLAWQGHWWMGLHHRDFSSRAKRAVLPLPPLLHSLTTRNGLSISRLNAVNSSSKEASRSKRARVSAILSRILKPSRSTLDDNGVDVVRLQRENSALRDAVLQLEAENEKLQKEVASRIVLETFEGEGKLRRAAEERAASLNSGGMAMTITGEEMFDDDDPSLWCDELEAGVCPVEPTVSFKEALRDRACWLVGLLVLQSLSGIILARNEQLLVDHPVIIYFLTMLVGAGGNAGNQASVRVIRGLALGTLNERTQSAFLTREVKMAVSLTTILSTAGFLRASVFQTPLPETLTITAALALIVFSSICLGAVLPLLLKRIGVDPAHSSTTIQVIMDILGVVLAVFVSSLLLDSPFGLALVSRLSRRFG